VPAATRASQGAPHRHVGQGPPAARDPKAISTQQRAEAPSAVGRRARPQGSRGTATSRKSSSPDGGGSALLSSCNQPGTQSFFLLCSAKVVCRQVNIKMFVALGLWHLFDSEICSVAPMVLVQLLLD
jgi:hypothetical protein